MRHRAAIPKPTAGPGLENSQQAEESTEAPGKTDEHQAISKRSFAKGQQKAGQGIEGSRTGCSKHPRDWPEEHPAEGIPEDPNRHCPAKGCCTSNSRPSAPVCTQQPDPEAELHENHRRRSHRRVAKPRVSERRDPTLEPARGSRCCRSNDVEGKTQRHIGLQLEKSGEHPEDAKAQPQNPPGLRFWGGHQCTNASAVPPNRHESHHNEGDPEENERLNKENREEVMRHRRASNPELGPSHPVHRGLLRLVLNTPSPYRAIPMVRGRLRTRWPPKEFR